MNHRTRGTAFVDDTIRDIFFALRTFKRAPLVVVTIVFTVALGLGLVAAVFTMVNALLFRADRVPDVHQMFAVERTRNADGQWQRFNRAEFDALRRETNVFTNASAVVFDVDSRIDSRTTYGTFVTGNYFEVVGVRAAMGRALTPADDEPSTGQPVMVLSDRGWDRMFARDPAIVGRRLRVNDTTFEIVGVMPQGFRGLTVAPDDYWAPLSSLRYVQPFDGGQQADAGLEIIGRLKPGLSSQTAQAGLAVWDAGRSNGRRVERAASNINLVPKRGTVPLNDETVMMFGPLFFAFGLILLIGYANVTNLLLARAVARQREIGIRLSLGATRRRIVRQLLTESLLLALVAAAGALAVSRVVLELIISAVMTSMAADLGDIRLFVPAADWRVLLFLLVGAGVSTIGFGLAPALQATRVEPVRTIRGEVVKDARPGWTRHLLIGLQVSASALLLISAAVFLRSAFAAAAADPGVRTADTVLVHVATEATRAQIVQAVKAEPSVTTVAASWPDAPMAVFAETGGARTAISYKLVSPEYFNVLGIAVVRGRTFDPAERSASLSVAVVSETTARALWPNGDALGQLVRLEPQTFTVIGVVRDVVGLRIAPFRQDVIYVPANVDMANMSLIARVNGDPEQARQKLLDRVTLIDPLMARQVFTLRTMARAEMFVLQAAFWLTVALGSLALALTLSGLFSVLSYLVEQRTREIGVRIALGATTRDVVRVILLQSLRPVFLGLVIGGGLAAGLSVLLLATPAATIGKIVYVLDPVAYAASLLVIVAACLAAASIPASRAARLNPTQALRQQ